MPYKLLLADDSVTIQRVIELTFADEDVKVTAVGDGQSAIDRIEADPPDIVLADVGMPGRDGYEVASFVKDNPQFSHIPVLLLTGAFEPVDESRARAVRCNGVLAKPFEPQLLIGRVKELLAASGGEPASAPLGAEEPAGPATAPARDDDDTGPVPVAQPANGFTADDFTLDTGGISESIAATPPADVSLDDYFDRLDAAFANLSGAPAGQLKAAAGEADTSWAPSASGAWSAADPVSLSSVPPPSAQEPGARTAGDAAGGRQGGSAVTVADAFAALLHAEQLGVAPQADGGEVAMPGGPAAAPVVTDALVEQVLERLAERLGADTMHDLVARVVSETAERLVRQEIERLKALLR